MILLQKLLMSTIHYYTFLLIGNILVNYELYNINRNYVICSGINDIKVE